jgi:hypothetical protein
MARRITLTRDERIALGEAVEGGGTFQPLSTAVAGWKVEQLVTKLQHRGLLDATGTITDEGHRAMAENRQTKPKGAHA